MGLDIRVNDKKYSWSYSALHQIRALALVYVGIPETINGKYCSFMLTFFCLTQDQGDSINSENLTNYFHFAMVAGHLFPNLLFHSDCEGEYSKDGKINLDTYKNGNSIELLMELDLIKSNKNCQKTLKKSERLNEQFTDFYDCVKEAVSSDKKILFR